MTSPFCVQLLHTDRAMAATTAPANGNTNEDPTQVFANGLLKLLEPVVFECDMQMQAVFLSQKELSDQIDKLASGTL